MTTTKRRHRHRFGGWELQPKVEGFALRQKRRCLGRRCFEIRTRVAHYHGNAPCFVDHVPQDKSWPKDCRRVGGVHFWMPNQYAAKLPDVCGFCGFHRTSEGTKT